MKKVLQFIGAMLICSSIQLNAQTATAPAAGDGTKGNPYQIATLDNLYWMAIQVKNGTNFDNKNFVQVADIDASATGTWTGSYAAAIASTAGDGFLPIGIKVNSTTVYPFKGNYDGQNHVISGLYTSCTNTSNVQGIALFGVVDGNDTIQNIRLVNPSVTHKGQRMAALIGTRDANHTAETTTILNCSVTGGTITYPSGTTGVGAGSFVGNSPYPLTIKNCYSSCSINVNGGNQAGGIVGLFNGLNTTATQLTIENCNFSGSITGASNTGGLIGNSNKNVNAITITNCYVSGTVTCTTAASAGAFVGALIAPTIGSFTVNNGFYDNTVISFGAVGNAAYTGITGKTTAEMQTQSTYAGWDFATTWGIASGFKGGYPYLTYFTPMAKAATSITSSGFTANWAAVTGATGYKLDVATDAAFTNMVVTDESVEGTSFDVTGLTAATPYYYRVRSINNVISGNSNVITTATSIATALSVSSDDQVKVIVVNGALRVENADSYVLFNAKGAKVASVSKNTSSTVVMLQPGIYVVKSSGNVQKVVLK